jgi:hypothetical protein
MATEPHTADILDKLVLLVVSLRDRAKVAEAAIEKLGISPSEVHVAISAAYERIRGAARWNADEELGEAILRLNDLYERALRVQDVKSALAAQKELNKLRNTYSAARRRPAAPPMMEGK